MIGHSIAEAIFWVAAISCLVAQIAILRSAITAPMSEPRDGALPRPRRGIEVAWTFVPAVALIVIFVVTWREIRDRRVGNETRAVASAPAVPAAP